MSNAMPYMAKETIECDAEMLLFEFKQARGVTLEPPIPVEDIIEKHLKLSIDFDDMDARHNILRTQNGDPSILGSINGDGSIFIDESLDPEEHWEKETRYRFTLAHELGHHRLHKTVFGAMRKGASVQNSRSLEWQANYFASCILMPRKRVYEMWIDTHKLKRPWVYRWSYGDPRRQASLTKYGRPGVPHLTHQEEREMFTSFDNISRPFACYFGVSVEAARIRLENLGLLRRAGVMSPLKKAS